MQLVRSWKQLQMPVSHCGPRTFCAFSCFCAISTSSILLIHPGGGAGRIGRARPTDALELQPPTDALPTKLVVPFPSLRRGAFPAGSGSLPSVCLRIWRQLANGVAGLSAKASRAAQNLEPGNALTRVRERRLRQFACGVQWES